MSLRSVARAGLRWTTDVAAERQSNPANANPTPIQLQCLKEHRTRSPCHPGPFRALLLTMTTPSTTQPFEGLFPLVLSLRPSALPRGVARVSDSVIMQIVHPRGTAHLVMRRLSFSDSSRSRTHHPVRPSISRPDWKAPSPQWYPILFFFA